MSFDIHLMRNSSPKNQLDKSLTNITTATGTLKEDTSIIDPVIKIQCSMDSVRNCNYMYVPNFGRYYFVTDIRSITNSIVEFTAHVDVLTTYAGQIRGNTAIVKRQENRWNLYLDDGTFNIYQNPHVLTKNFPSGFNTQEFVFAIAGT